MPGPKSGFFVGGDDSWSHDSITENAIRSLYSEFGFTSPNQISSAALDNITWQNGQTDLDDSEEMLSAPHFVGENFYGANERLKAYKNRIDQLMSPFQPSGRAVADSQYFLGRALHTLQDFYAHSNWVELHPRPPGPTQFPIFHELGDPNQTMQGRPLNERTCRDCVRNTCAQCENILATNQLTTAYYGGTTDSPKKPSWKCSHGGRVLTVKDESGRGLISAGINKDTADCVVSPFNERHHDAAGAAIRATQEYLVEIRDLIGNVQMRQLLGGGGFARIGFVVDTTGSMGFEIASVRQQILSIIQTRLSLGIPTQYFLFPFNDPGFGTITMTTDPNVMTSAVNALTANAGGDCPEPVNAALLRAFGEITTGGDILMFTDARPSDPTLTFAVGSFARSSGIRLTSVFSGANDTFGCPFLDSRFSTMSFDTGGQFFSLDPSEAGLISHLGHFLAVPNQVDLFSRIGVRSTVDQIFNVPIDSTMPRMILSVTGTGATNIVVRRPDNSVVQPNDPNVTRVAVSTGVIYSILNPAVGNWGITITGTGLGMNHVYTSPVAYEASDAYAQSSAESQDNDSHGPSASLEPAPAAEPLPAMQGAEEFTIRVAGESTIDVSSFEFLEPHQVGPHPGFVPLTSNPIAGRTTTVGAKLIAEGASTVGIQFRGLDGTVLQTLNLQELPWPGDDPALPLPRETHFKEYIGNITVPNVPFQVYVSGTTTGGSQYQRVVPGVYRPQTLEIIAGSIPNLHPGQSFTHNIQVKNSGSADTFQLSGTDDLNFLASISPANFSLNTNETKNVKVVINVPANAVPLSTDNVHFAVEGSVSNASKIVGPFLVSEVPALRMSTFTVTPIGGDNDAFLDPGEGATVTAQLINDGASTATNIRAGLSASTAGVEVSQGDSLYADIAPSANGTNLTPFVFYLPPNMECGQTIQLSLNVTSEGNGVASEGQHNFTVSVGQQTNTSATRSFTGPAVSIPDGNPAGVNVPITVSGLTGQVDDLNFRIDGTTCNSTTTVGLNHTWVEDLNATLKSPGGTTVSLFEAVGGNGDNFCNTLLDDQATNLIQNVTAANAPFTGSFKPKSPLNAFRGENPNGVWTLNVTDFVTADAGSVRAFSLLFANTQFSCNAAPADTTAPSCTPTDFRPGPPASADITTQDTGTGIASIHVTLADNVDVVVPPFTPGTTLPIVVSGTLIDPNVDGFFEIETVDVAGNVSACERTITGGGGGGTPTIILSDDFNDNNLNTENWRTDTLLTIFATNPNVLVAETAQRLEFGPLLVNTADAYGGVASSLLYTFPAGGYSFVELIQTPSAQTNADAGFAIGNFLGYYQMLVSHGSLMGIKNVLYNGTTLFTIPYDPVAHRFLRIRHNSATGQVIFETAPGSGGVPGTWVQRFSEPWNSTLGFNSFQFELRGGTLGAESNQPGKAIFDNFQFGSLSP
jgi:subtilisin-like proprotein convertase family protein